MRHRLMPTSTGRLGDGGCRYKRWTWSSVASLLAFAFLFPFPLFPFSFFSFLFSVLLLFFFFHFAMAPQRSLLALFASVTFAVSVFGAPSGEPLDSGAVFGKVRSAKRGVEYHNEHHEQ